MNLSGLLARPRSESCDFYLIYLIAFSLKNKRGQRSLEQTVLIEGSIQGSSKHLAQCFNVRRDTFLGQRLLGTLQSVDAHPIISQKCKKKKIKSNT